MTIHGSPNWMQLNNFWINYLLSNRSSTCQPFNFQTFQPSYAFPITLYRVLSLPSWWLITNDYSRFPELNGIIFFGSNNPFQPSSTCLIIPTCQRANMSTPSPAGFSAPLFLEGLGCANNLPFFVPLRFILERIWALSSKHFKQSHNLNPAPS